MILQSFARFEQVNASFDWKSDFIRSVFGVLRYLASIRAILSVWNAEHSSIIVIFITYSLALTERAVPLAFLHPCMPPDCPQIPN